MNKKMNKIMSASDKCYRKKKEGLWESHQGAEPFHFALGGWKTSL